jgi:hypothetical protein
MVLKGNLMLFPPVSKVTDIGINLRETGKMIIGLEPLLGGAGDFKRLVVLPHHVECGNEPQPSARSLFTRSRPFEQGDRFLIVLNRLFVLFVGIKRVRHKPARLGEQVPVIGL